MFVIVLTDQCDFPQTRLSCPDTMAVLHGILPFDCLTFSQPFGFPWCILEALLHKLNDLQHFTAYFMFLISYVNLQLVL